MESGNHSGNVRILIDHNIEGWALLLWDTLTKTGWLELLPLEIIMFSDVGLSDDMNDRMVWRFAQANYMILLTANRNMIGDDSLERTIRDENTVTSLPVLTIGNVEHLRGNLYRNACAERLLEIVLDLENYMGTARMYIP